MLIKVLKNISKIRHKKYRRNDVLIFDGVGSNILDKIILADIRYTILYSRKEVLYLSLEIMVRLIKNIIKALFRGKYRTLYLLYLLSCVESIKPKIVITLIDNSYLFQAISRLYTEAEFYAIQNGVKLEISLKDYLPEYPPEAKLISLPNLVCFGQQIIDIYRKHKHKVDHFFPLGSLIGGYYKSQVSDPTAAIQSDICLVSQWRSDFTFRGQDLESKQSFDMLNRYLSRYQKESGLRLCIATCSNDKREIEYFQTFYDSSQVVINEFDRLNFSTYREMDKSHVIVANDSCAAFEAFGWGKKVLFCNFTEMTAYNFPKPGIWSTNKIDFDDFCNKLDDLIKMDYKKYILNAKESMRYVMNYDFSKPAHVFIKKLIHDKIKERN